jgi:hypothetical protein
LRLAQPNRSAPARNSYSFSALPDHRMPDEGCSSAWLRSLSSIASRRKPSQQFEAESVSHSDQFRQTPGVHLAHHLAAVRLHRDLAIPSSPPASLFNRPETISAITSFYYIRARIAPPEFGCQEFGASQRGRHD